MYKPEIRIKAGSSTGNLLVAEEDDIDKVFQNASKVVAVHSEDEAILKVNKKLIKEGEKEKTVSETFVRSKAA